MKWNCHFQFLESCFERLHVCIGMTVSQFIRAFSWWSSVHGVRQSEFTWAQIFALLVYWPLRSTAGLIFHVTFSTALGRKSWLAKHRSPVEQWRGGGRRTCQQDLKHNILVRNMAEDGEREETGSFQGSLVCDTANKKPANVVVFLYRVFVTLKGNPAAFIINDISITFSTQAKPL